MPKRVHIQEQIKNITYEINSYISLLYMIPCVYTRNAIFNLIRDRLYIINFLINQLDDDISLDITGINTTKALSANTNFIQSSTPGSNESGIEQLSQGIQPSDLQNISGVPVQTGQGIQTIFTLEQLSKYNGINGNPAYVAVNGMVYDVTNIATWAAATHFGLVAGRNLTQEFASCHAGQNILSKLKVVGRLSQ